MHRARNDRVCKTRPGCNDRARNWERAKAFHKERNVSPAYRINRNDNSAADQANPGRGNLDCRANSAALSAVSAYREYRFLRY
jgi:hypothetical protein